MRFVRLRSPPRILTADLGVFKSCARNSTSASFARFSTAGACSLIFRAPSITPTISSLLARGCTRTTNETVPVARFSAISASIGHSPSSFILHGGFDLCIQSLCRPPRPIRIAQQFTRKKNQIGLLGRQYRLGLRRLGDHANRARRNASFLANRLCKSSLISRPQRNLYSERRSSAGGINQIHSQRLQFPRQRNRLRQIPAAFFPIRRRNAHEKRQALRPNLPDSSDNLRRQANSIFQIAAILVRPRVRKRRQELVQQIAVRGMDFNHLESRRQRAFRRFLERPDNFSNLAHGQLARHRIARVEGQRARPNRLPPALFHRDGLASNPRRSRACLPPCMRELHPRHRSMRP